MQIIEFEFFFVSKSFDCMFLITVLMKKKFEVSSSTCLTFSAAIYELFAIHISYTIELIESHFPIDSVGFDHSLVRTDDSDLRISINK